MTGNMHDKDVMTEVPQDIERTLKSVAVEEIRNYDGEPPAPARLATRQTSLEDVFIALTGRRLHEGGAGR